MSGIRRRSMSTAIRRLGVTPHHRRSFAPIRLALSPPADLLALLEAGPLALSENERGRGNARGLTPRRAALTVRASGKLGTTRIPAERP